MAEEFAEEGGEGSAATQRTEFFSSVDKGVVHVYLSASAVVLWK